jgi:hypothetical protein
MEGHQGKWLVYQRPKEVVTELDTVGKIWRKSILPFSALQSQDPWVGLEGTV